MDTALDERHSHHEGSRTGLKPAPTSFASFALFAVRFFLLRALHRFVVKFAFSSTIFCLRLRRTTIFEITDVSAISEIFDCTNHEQLVKRRPASKIVRGSRPTCSGFQVGTKSMLHLSFFNRRKTANLRQMRPITDNAFPAETSFSLEDAGISTV